MIKAIYFTGMARRNSILPTKIVSYYNALECLFTTGSNKVSHNIADRLSLLLCIKKDEKQLFCSTVREAYTYRSHIVHGQSLREEEDSLRIMSKNLDYLLRCLIVDDHEVFSKSDEEIELFFDEMAFT